MQDVSRVVGDPVIVFSRSKNREYRLRGLNFESLGGLQGQLLKDQRKRKLETAAELAAMLQPEQAAAVIEKARSEAENIAYLSNKELQEFVTTDVGAVYLIWFLFEQDYPGEVTRGDVMQMLANGELSEAKLQEILTTAFGGGPAGNLTGQKAAAVSPAEKAAGDMLSGFSNSRRKRVGSASRQAKRSE